MASDNIIAGAAGGLQGINDLLGQFINYQYQRRLKNDDMLGELNQYEQKLKIQQPYEENKLRLESELKALNDRRAVAKTPVLKSQAMNYAKQGTNLPVNAEIIDDTVKPEKEPGLEAIIREMADNLPKFQEQATAGKTSLKSINRALQLVDKGVTGKAGEVKAFMAPYADILGTANTENLDDAQTFQLLTRAIVGPMRLEIVGPGPVSEYEQKLMQQISGGGGASKKAAKELLGYYKTLAKNKVTRYNSSVQGAHTLSPRFKDLYQQIEFDPEQEEQSTVTTPTIKTGGKSSLQNLINKHKNQ